MWESRRCEHGRPQGVKSRCYPPPPPLPPLLLQNILSVWGTISSYESIFHHVWPSSLYGVFLRQCLSPPPPYKISVGAHTLTREWREEGWCFSIQIFEHYFSWSTCYCYFISSSCNLTARCYAIAIFLSVFFYHPPPPSCPICLVLSIVLHCHFCSSS